MRKKKSTKAKLSKGDLSLRIVAITVTAISMLLILFPFALTISNAMKDNVKIYDVPPKVLPDAAKSLSLVLDYSGFEGTNEELEATLQKDLVSSMYGIYTKLDRDSIFEIKLYGVRNGKTILYSRAHQIQLQLNKDFGIYKGTVLKAKTLFYKDRAVKSSEEIGYTFNPDGIAEHPAPTGLDTEFIANMHEKMDKKFPLIEQITSCNIKTNNMLLLESFVHYMKVPQRIYYENKVIKRFGFMSFVGNTALVISFAICIQLLLDSVCGFVISRLMSRRAGNIALVFFLGGMMIPFVSIMLPQLLMFKEMGAYNNYAALLLPYLCPFGFFVFLFKRFFDQIPNSYFEAARIDGASNFYLYAFICMPLSKPIIAMVALQVFLGNWGDFFWPWLVTEDQNLWTLNVALYNISKNVAAKQNAVLGISLVTMLPVIIISMIFSKQLKASIMSSGIKE